MLTYEARIATLPGREAWLSECVESLRTQGVEPIITSDTRYSFPKWNESMDLCTSDLLFLPHDDDVYHNGYIDEMVSYMESHPDVAAVFCMDKFIDKDGRRMAGGNMLPIPEQDTYDFKTILNGMLVFGNFLRCETVCFRMSLIGDMRYPLDIGCGGAADTAFWFDILNKFNIGIINKQLVSNRQHPAQDTQSQRVAVVPDHWSAIDHAISLRPDDLNWDNYIAVEKIRVINNQNREMANVKARIGKGGEVRFIVVHEPPDNAGTGVVAADRVRRGNNVDAQISYYVFPNKELTSIQEGWFKGCPIIGCGPEQFGLVVKRFKPSVIEYHHTLGWGDKILSVETDARKELYLHDRWMWSEHPHEDGPFRDTRSYLKEISTFGNSEWTCREAQEKLGVEVKLFDPFVPLPHGPMTFRKRVGFFGGFSTTKGVHILLQAARESPDVLFVLFTQPPESMMEGGRLYGHKNILVMGAYSRSDLHLLVHLVDLVVVPSVFESHGLVKKEIESLGVPVISTATGGMAGEVQPGDVQALVDSIK
jgi:glycosyltransferase involved in cell wall biosynthesis